jgi:pimeloyl-ACP methyl ester carboxylesterase
LLACLGIGAAGCGFPNILVFPGHVYQGKSEAVIPPEPGAEKVHLTTAAGDHVIAIFGRALLPNGAEDPNAAHRPTLIYFYGNASAIAWSLNEFRQFRRLDANVLLPDFVGYGLSTGIPTEATSYATADACYDYLIHRPDVDSHQIMPVGWSLGAALAIDLAARRPVAGVMIFNGFTTIRAAADHNYPLLPINNLLPYRFDNLKKISLIKCPIFLCTGMRDTVVPPIMGDQLTAAARAPVTRLIIRSATHFNIFVAEPDNLFSAMRGFLDKLP